MYHRGQSLVIDLVEKKEDLGNAIALNSLMFNGARLIGPSVAGLLLATAGEGICFLSNSISYLFVIGSLLMMKVNTRKRERTTTPMFTELKEGFSYAFAVLPPIRHIILLLGPGKHNEHAICCPNASFCKGGASW